MRAVRGAALALSEFVEEIYDADGVQDRGLTRNVAGLTPILHSSLSS